jgi:hypothetical protein
MKIRVRSMKDGFRRAGMGFSRTPREIDVDKRTFDVLKGEPMLVVEAVPEAGEEKKAATEEKKTGDGTAGGAQDARPAEEARRKKETARTEATT